MTVHTRPIKKCPNNLRVFVPLLVAALLAADVVAAASTERHLPWPAVSTAILLALAFSQVCLMAAWVSLGGEGAVYRFGLLFATVAIWTVVVAGFELTEWLVILVAPAVSVLGILLVVRCLVARVMLVDLTTPADQPALEAVPVQFSLRSLFLWTTIAALLAWLVPLLPVPEAGPGIPSLLMLTVPFTLTAVLAVWMALAGGHAVFQLALLLVFAPLAGAGGFYWYSSSADACLANAAMCTLHALLMVGPLWIFRLAGYRLCRVRDLAMK